MSRYLRDYSQTIKGKEQLIISSFAKALEVIPRQIAENAGFDSTEILTKLRAKHNSDGGHWFGVDIMNEDICDTYESFVWEPSLIKLNAITAATEACCIILSVDVTVSNERKEEGMDPAMNPSRLRRQT